MNIPRTSSPRAPGAGPPRALGLHLTAFNASLRPARGPRFEFHIHAGARDKYGFDQDLFSLSGNVVFANFAAARTFAQKMNEKRALESHPGEPVRAGHLNAMGLIDEILHYVLRLYEETANPGVFARALARLNEESAASRIDPTLRSFGTIFPPREVYTGNLRLDEYFRQRTGGKPHAEVELEEMSLLYLANENPAFSPYRELFDDTRLTKETGYTPSIGMLERFFQSEVPFGPDHQHIFDLLRAPMRASPHSLEGQLEFMRTRWGMLISDKFLRRMLSARDFIKEDMRIIHPGGPPETVVPTYRRGTSENDSFEAERFTRDLDWMPSVVILAKNTYVWLDQLSGRYQRPITRLDQVPDEELDRLAGWNFTGLWLIGLWERSPASQKLKQMMGNPEAVSSAYSLYDYDIAADLGGEEAFRNLRDRAWRRGIRLAGDMVPNHMGITSRWVHDHPDYFVQSGYRPFPNYAFTGANLSEDPSLGIRIEDGYWSRRDAAVVFERLDHRTGEARYIYHGNDGTSMPWNDTAQLNFVDARVREAVIQTILHVARKFPIIRFDAAMTLTKKHFQRLWYPEPGTGGDIPSRADHAMSREEFDRLFPTEFWREVVDRINAEMPNTLLLAEAFWLLEGYFVRTLGMHRVYNSAFMHMLTREENAKYRELIRNTLHYNAEILKRYVNFMSNPDEQTAIAQFGKDDKYFGVATLMVTLPGLPMFGHGQIEGYGEKYGMEYRRAYYNEIPDEHLIRRHEREIFPLMKRRHLFSQVENFELYDFIDVHGHLNENVFVYSNRSGDERALVCYHNRFEETSGWVKTSAGKADPAGSGPVVRKSLAAGLGLSTGAGIWYIFREHRSQLEYLRSGRELDERGMFLDLKAFQYQVYLDLQEVEDRDGEYRRLAERLGGKGVPDVRLELRRQQLAAVHEAFGSILEPGMIRRVTDAGALAASNGHEALYADLSARTGRFLNACNEFARRSAPPPSERDLKARIRLLLSFNLRVRPEHSGEGGTDPAVGGRLRPDPGHASDAALALGWMAYDRLRATAEKDSPAAFDELLLGEAFENALGGLGISDDHLRGLFTILAHCRDILEVEGLAGPEWTEIMARLAEDGRVRRFMRVNEYNGILYYNKEAFEALMDWLFSFAVQANTGKAERGISEALRRLTDVKAHARRTGYELARLAGAAERPSPTVGEG